MTDERGVQRVRSAFGPAPRKAELGDKPGAYALAVRKVTPEVDPGEAIELKVMVSGYGYIGGAKLVVFPSPDSYVPEESTYTEGIYWEDDENGITIYHGLQTRTFDNAGMTLVLGGIKDDRWPHPTIFFDAPNPSTGDQVALIATEYELTRSPIEVSLRTKEGVRTGAHDTQFVFTYYDGERWQTDKQVVTVHINNFIQQRPRLLGWLTIGAVVIAFLSLVSDLAVNLPELLPLCAELWPW